MENGKRIMFVTGPVEIVEEELAALNADWTPVEFAYHVIVDRAHVTVRLTPSLAAAARRQGVQVLVGSPLTR